VKKLLIATHNKAKFEEMKMGVKQFAPHLKTISLQNLKISEQPEETGKTFEENAKLKAYFYSKLTNLPTIADDGGIMIDALNGEPGVKTRRWLGYEMSDQELIDHTLKSLQNVPANKRTAQFKACIYFFDPATQTEMQEEAEIKGIIARKQIKTLKANGYPFRLIFIVDSLNKYYANITPEENLAINHRLKALRFLMKKVSKHLL